LQKLNVHIMKNSQDLRMKHKPITRLNIYLVISHKNVRTNRLKFNGRVSESLRFLAKSSCQTQSNGPVDQTCKHDRAVNQFYIFAGITECMLFPRTFDAALFQFSCFRVLYSPFTQHWQTKILLSTFHIICENWTLKIILFWNLKIMFQ